MRAINKKVGERWRWRKSIKWSGRDQNIFLCLHVSPWGVKCLWTAHEIRTNLTSSYNPELWSPSVYISCGGYTIISGSTHYTSPNDHKGFVSTFIVSVCSRSVCTQVGLPCWLNCLIILIWFTFLFSMSCWVPLPAKRLDIAAEGLLRKWERPPVRLGGGIINWVLFGDYLNVFEGSV